MKIYKKENDMIEVYEMSINDEAVKLYKDSLANRIKFYDIKSSDNNKLRKFDKQDIMSAGALNEYMIGFLRVLVMKNMDKMRY